jgi:hypothetical protein
MPTTMVPKGLNLVHWFARPLFPNGRVNMVHFEESATWCPAWKPYHVWRLGLFCGAEGFDVSCCLARSAALTGITHACFPDLCPSAP